MSSRDRASQGFRAANIAGTLGINDPRMRRLAQSQQEAYLGDGLKLDKDGKFAVDFSTLSPDATRALMQQIDATARVDRSVEETLNIDNNISEDRIVPGGIFSQIQSNTEAIVGLQSQVQGLIDAPSTDVVGPFFLERFMVPSNTDTSWYLENWYSPEYVRYRVHITNAYNYHDSGGLPRMRLRRQSNQVYYSSNTSYYKAEGASASTYASHIDLSETMDGTYRTMEDHNNYDHWVGAWQIDIHNNTFHPTTETWNVPTVKVEGIFRREQYAIWHPVRQWWSPNWSAPVDGLQFWVHDQGRWRKGTVFTIYGFKEQP